MILKFISACTLCLLVIFNGLSQRLPKALLVTGNGNLPVAKENYPPWVHEFHNDKVVEILKEIVQVDTTADLAMLNDKTLKQYDVIISNSIFLAPTTQQLDALYNFVAGGKSLLTLHCGILSFLNFPKYEELMGGIFIGGPSTEPESFPVVTENTEFWGYPYSFRKTSRHPVSRVVSDFTIKDELYYFQPLKAEFHVIARAENHPVMWWHPVVKGKVMSLTLGHSLEAKNNEGYQQLLTSGIRWLVGYPLIEDANLKPLSTRAKSYPGYLNLKALTGEQNIKSFDLLAQSSASIITPALNKDGSIDLRMNGQSGNTSLAVVAIGENGLTTKKAYDIQVHNDGDGNIASYQGNTITCSSSENRALVADVNSLIDGDMTTLWSSAFLEQAWVVIDLQKDYHVGKVVLHWQDAFALQYSIQISRDNKNWNTVSEVDNSDGGVDTITLNNVQARYIKLNFMKRAMPRYGYSLYEVEVFRK